MIFRLAKIYKSLPFVLLVMIFPQGAVQANLPKDFIQYSPELQAVLLDMAFPIEEVESKWGQDTKLSSSKTYIRYLDDYLARSSINFEESLVEIEVLASSEPQAQLRQAIVSTLLSEVNPDGKSVFLMTKGETKGTPYLFGKVKDQDGKFVRYPWRAGRFADYLMANKLEKRQRNGNSIYRVRIPLINDFKVNQVLSLEESVMNASFKYDVSNSLIYGIIETESAFNPYAISHANAYGLMQVVPSTAGADVYQKIYGRRGKPNQKTLFSPQKNIDIGTAYLKILRDDYLRKIWDPIKREYCMISAYNGGAGNVFKTFSGSRKRAIEIINSMSRKAVYKSLTEDHPRSESRNYLKKVIKHRRKYDG